MTEPEYITSIPEDEHPVRSETITQKIGPEVTGLKSGIFVHVDWIERRGRRKVVGVRCSERSKDGNTLDGILCAVGDSVTSIMREEINDRDWFQYCKQRMREKLRAAS